MDERQPSSLISRILGLRNHQNLTLADLAKRGQLPTVVIGPIQDNAASKNKAERIKGNKNKTNTLLGQ